MAIDQSPQARAQAASRVVRAQIEALAADLGALDAPGWAAQSFCDAWSVRDVASHMAESNDRFLQIVTAALDDAAVPDFPAALRAERQAAVRARPTADIVDQLVRCTGAVLDRLEAAAPGELARTVTVPAGHLVLAQLPVQRLTEWTLHSWDIRWARDRQVTLDADAAPLLLDAVLANVGRLGGRGAASAPPATYRLNLAGSGGGPVTITVADGAARGTRGATDRPDATLAMPVEAAVRLIWGRLDLEQALADGTARLDSGDRSVALALGRLFRPA